MLWCFHQLVADLLAQHGVADDDGDDVAGVHLVGDAGRVEAAAEVGDALLVSGAFDLALLEVADAGERACGDGRREGGGEDEAAREASDEVDQGAEPVM